MKPLATASDFAKRTQRRFGGPQNQAADEQPSSQNQPTVDRRAQQTDCNEVVGAVIDPGAKRQEIKNEIQHGECGDRRGGNGGCDWVFEDIMPTESTDRSPGVPCRPKMRTAENLPG